MKKLTFICFAFFVAGTTVTAQKKLHPKQIRAEFTENPVLHPVPPQYANEPAIILQHDVTIDYKFEGKGTNRYYTLHNVIKVLDEKGIASFNTIGIPVSSSTRVPLIRARTIDPAGKVHEIAKDMIKVTRDEYGRNKIVIAMEGVEKNSEIELLLKEIIPYSAFGSEYFQFSVPLLDGHLSVSYPKEFVFEEKGYNGFPTVKDTLLSNRRHLDISVADVPGLDREPYSFYDIHRMRAEYRVNHFTNANHNDFSEQYTWDELARWIFDNNYKITDKERAAVNKYLTTLGVHANGNELQNIKKIENGIKNDIVLYSYVEGEETDVLDSIILKRAATSAGYLKLFAACLTQAGVKHSLGLAADNSEYKIDTKFENWHSLDYYVFYFPNQEKYMYPLSVYYRYPVIPAALVNGKGVFCIIPPKGTITTSLAELRKITPLAAKENEVGVAAGVLFNEDMEPWIDVSYSYKGYSSPSIRQALLTETKDKEKDLVHAIVEFAERKEDIVKYSISNEQPENMNGNKPLVITAGVNASPLVSQAGNRYLFNIGALTGHQNHLYNEKKRLLPVDMAYPSSYSYTFTVNIPKGCKVMNPEALKVQAEYVDRNLNMIASFTADYTLTLDKKNGDKLVVTVHEYYPVMHLPLADWDRFKEVVNAAADFDKVTLLIQKDKKGGGAKPKAKPKAIASK